ncbi:hypothetical protein [Agarilytica rhodophyticola]|uniref:hypothetical protein n=1 Tax=Agarilytica rhodophyticola TaxID=1737490 RepID=UPI000B345613|nr:hypothetical protein [Agarilytica rhodophyticola]
MNDFTSLKKMLQQWGELKPQDSEDWQGDFPLPDVLVSFYQEVGPWGPTYAEKIGPIGLEIESFREPISIPPLFKLWELQSGYRWHGNTGERLNDWKDTWIVVAECCGDPFVLDVSSGEMLFGFHGAGKWDLASIAADINTAFGALSVIGSTLLNAGEEGYDDEMCDYTEDTKKKVIEALSTFLNSENEASELLAVFEW